MMITTTPSLRKAAVAASILCLNYHHVTAAAVADASLSSSGAGITSDYHNNADVQEFTPPKLSFTAADYFASLKDDNVVNSVQQHEDEEEELVVPWTIFQGVPSSNIDPSSSISSSSKELEELAQQKKASIQRRSGPLLTLFPDNSAASAATNNNNKHAKHAVLTPTEQRSYLVTHGKDCHPSSSDNDNILDRYDIFLNSPTLSNLTTKLWK